MLLQISVCNKNIIKITAFFFVKSFTCLDQFLCMAFAQFKWSKQHLRIKTFFGTSQNAVKTQICTAISVYVLVAIIKKRLELPTELYTMLQILSLTLFEKIPLYQLVTQTDYKTDHRDILNQLNLFD